MRLMARGNKKVIVDFMKSIKEDPLRYYYIQSNLKKLINDGVDISTQGNGGNTLLHLAVSLENKKLLAMFIKAKVLLDLANDNGETPLHKAVSKGNIDIIKLLIKSGCDINCPREMEQTPLHLAVICGRIEIVKLLVDSGADILVADELNNLPIDYAIDECDVEMIKYFLSKQIVDEKRLDRISKVL